MKSEYDFSKGERGKFFRRDAVFEMPVYLEPDVMTYFTTRANAEGIALDTLLNRVLRGRMEKEKAGR